MSPYKKAGHSGTYWLTVTDAAGRKHRVATGTHDRSTAEAMGHMVHGLAARGRREWDLIRALLERGPGRRRRLSLGALYDAWRDPDPHALDALRSRLADVDLAEHVDAWAAAAAGRVRPATLRKYRFYVARLVAGSAGAGGALWRSALTPAALAAARDAVPGGPSSRLAHLGAWSSFFAFCVERGLLASNPLTDGRVAWPRDPDRARTVRAKHIARLTDVERFVAAMPSAELRAAAALREGVGADWDALEPMRREHVLDPARRLVYLPGDKTPNRVREVELEPWAWAHVAAYLAASPALPSAPMFTVGYEAYKRAHNATRDALRAAGVAIPAGYSPHNSRHTFAVRKRRDGWPDWKIAHYLGNTAQEIARTYGQFAATRADVVHAEAERLAAERVAAERTSAERRGA